MRDWLEEEIAAVIGEPLLERLVEGSRRHARAPRGRDGGGTRAAARARGRAAYRVRERRGARRARSDERRSADRDDAAAVGDAAERARTRARAGRVRPARPRRAGRASATDRRPRARAALRGARARRLRAQVALHVDRRARAGRLGALPGGRGRRHADAQLGRRWHERARRRDRRARGCADRLDADRRLARGDGGQDRAEGRATRFPSGRGFSTSFAASDSASTPCTSPTPSGRLLPETRDVLRAIARHDLILATGHLARDDTFAVVDAALEEGVARHRRHAPGVPVPELLARGPARARASAVASSSAA